MLPLRGGQVLLHILGVRLKGFAFKGLPPRVAAKDCRQGFASKALPPGFAAKGLPPGVAAKALPPWLCRQGFASKASKALPPGDRLHHAHAPGVGSIARFPNQPHCAPAKR